MFVMIRRAFDWFANPFSIPRVTQLAPDRDRPERDDTASSRGRPLQA